MPEGECAGANIKEETVSAELAATDTATLSTSSGVVLAEAC
jgi:hypothetical protein